MSIKLESELNGLVHSIATVDVVAGLDEGSLYGIYNGPKMVKTTTVTLTLTLIVLVKVLVTAKPA